MSLINQMLRDLEQRNRQAAKPAPKLELRSAPQDKPGGGLPWLVGTAIALGLLYLWQQQQPGQPNRQPAPAAVASAPIEPRPAPPQLSIDIPPAPPIAQTSQALTPLVANNDQQTLVINPAIPAESPLAEHSPAAPVPALKPLKTPSPSQQAEALYRRAQASNSPSTIREYLQKALTQNPSHLPARSMLLQTLLKAGVGTEEIGEFVEDSLQLFPDNLLFVKTRAHLYVQQKDFAAATRVLEKIDANTVADSAFLALLAAAYQQQQAFPQAEQTYRRLTQLQPDKAEHWLGLAISQDKLGQPQAARESYSRALEPNTLDAEVVNYIKQRLGALN